MRKAICIVGAVLMPLVYVAGVVSLYFVSGYVVLFWVGMERSSIFSRDGIDASDYFGAGCMGLFALAVVGIIAYGWTLASGDAYKKCQQWWKPRSEE